MHHITGNHRHTDNQLLLLKNGEEIFPLLLELIGNAQESIYIDQYAFHGDEVGTELAHALKKCADEGVKIYVIYDYLGSRYTPRSFWKDL
jgi:cardiolipin synthase